MSRRRKLSVMWWEVDEGWWRHKFLRPVEAARQERVRRHVRRVKRRAARRWPT